MFESHYSSQVFRFSHIFQRFGLHQSIHFYLSKFSSSNKSGNLNKYCKLIIDGNNPVPTQRKNGINKYQIVYFYHNQWGLIHFDVVVAVIIWWLDLKLLVQSMPITTKVVSLNLAHGEVYSIQHNYIR